MKNELNIGILGFGKMGEIRYKTLKKMEQCLPVMVYEKNQEVECPKSLKRAESPQELIASKEVDALMICVPNYLIKPYVILAMESGKHVFGEKTSWNFIKGNSGNEVCYEKSGCKLMFGFNHRHHQSVIKIKETVDSKRYGEILWMRGRYGKSV